MEDKPDAFETIVAAQETRPIDAEFANLEAMRRCPAAFGALFDCLSETGVLTGADWRKP